LGGRRRASVDASIFELIVAARCVEKGRRVEFIDEGSEKTPDLRCHDPYPLQIECKRKRVLSDYELAEERLMRRLFLTLELDAKNKGLIGRFELFLSVEAHLMPVEEMVARLVSQRLAAHPERHTEYSWGSVAFVPLPKHLDMPPTRIYSPHMLRAVFNWNSDLPEWDGLVCRGSWRRWFRDRPGIAARWPSMAQQDEKGGAEASLEPC
jgi:hypothetical protein